MDKDEQRIKIYDFIKSNILNGIVVITSLSYILYNMVVIKRTDLTLVECLASASIGIVIGFIIKQSLGESGFNKGYSSNIWATNLEKYSKACNLANDYIDRVDNFYIEEEIEKKKAYRRTNLMAVRLKYNDFFDKDGNYIEHNIKICDKMGKISPENDFIVLTRKQYRILKKCVRVKIYNLNLFSEYSNEIENDTHREKTDKDQRALMTSKNSLAMVLTAIVGVYFTAMWNAWDWGSFINATIQVCIWVSCGIVQLYRNYNYVVIEKVSKLTRKMELIIKFTRGCESGLYKENPYEVNYDRQEQVYNKTDTISIE